MVIINWLFGRCLAYSKASNAACAQELRQPRSQYDKHRIFKSHNEIEMMSMKKLAFGTPNLCLLRVGTAVFCALATG